MVVSKIEEMEDTTYISRVQIKNLLSFKTFNLKLDPRENIIVGTNGSGKSNFMKLIQYMIERNREYDKQFDDDSEIVIEIKLSDDNKQKIMNTLLFKSIEYQSNRTMCIKGELSNLRNEFDNIKHKNKLDKLIIKKKALFVDVNIKFNNSLEMDLSKDIEIYNKLLTEIYNNRIGDIHNISNTDVLCALGIDNLLESSSNNVSNTIFNEIASYFKFLINDILCISEIKQYIANDKYTLVFGDLSLYQTQEKLFEMKNNCLPIYDNIVKKFEQITKKKINIQSSLTTSDIYKHMYVIVHKNEVYKCSSGEAELMSFLVNYYDNDTHIMFIDEPCVHLSVQNLKKFYDVVISKNKGMKQIIIITHSPKFIEVSNIDNLIRFWTYKEVTKQISIKNIHIKNVSKYDIQKNICECINILFSNKCILVEGWHDKRFLDSLLKYTEDHIGVFPMGGKDSKLPFILKKIGIQHFTLYDSDFLIKSNKEFDVKKLNNLIENKYIKANNEKLQDEIEKGILSETFYLIDKNFIVIGTEYKDIEGLAKVIFGDDFNKKEWKNKSSTDIDNGIFEEMNKIISDESKYKDHPYKLLLDKLGCYDKKHINHVIEIKNMHTNNLSTGKKKKISSIGSKN